MKMFFFSESLFISHIINYNYLSASLTSATKVMGRVFKKKSFDYTYVYIYIYISRLIVLKNLQNNSFCLHNICVYCVYLLSIYKYTHIQHIF